MQSTVARIVHLFAAAKTTGITVAVSPHYYYSCDHQWQFDGPLEKLMHSLCMFHRDGPLNVDDFENSGSGFMSEYKPYILDGQTIVTSPHKVYGSETNDLALLLHKNMVFGHPRRYGCQPLRGAPPARAT